MKSLTCCIKVITAQTEHCMLHLYVSFFLSFKMGVHVDSLQIHLSPFKLLLCIIETLSPVNDFSSDF